MGRPTAANPARFSEAEIRALAAFITNDTTLLFRRADIPADDATIILLVRQLYTERIEHERAHATMRASLETTLDAPYDTLSQYGDAILAILENDAQPQPVDTEKGLIYQLHIGGEITWFVRFTTDPETDRERVTVYYKQTHDAARYIEADSEAYVALRDIAASLCADFTTPDARLARVAVTFEENGLKRLLDSAWDDAQHTQEQPA